MRSGGRWATAGRSTPRGEDDEPPAPRASMSAPIGGPQHCRVRAGTMSLGEEDHVNVKGAEPMKEANPFVSGIESTDVNRYYGKSRHSKK